MITPGDRQPADLPASPELNTSDVELGVAVPHHLQEIVATPANASKFP